MSFDLNGTRQLDASPEEIWTAMLDTAVLRTCLPAVKSIERISDYHFEIVFSKRFGMFPLTLPVYLDVSEIVPIDTSPTSWKLTARATHRVLGLASAGADVRVELVSSDQTLLHYTAFASVGEAVMKLLGDAFQSRIDKWVDGFFDKFQAALDQKRGESVA